ncbi:ATP-grasp domain-containing protein [Brevibacillus humidisoli]|uniref:ATP-grasp domain-containing protein n=1 Tax=Brevibacillus humidisoli TaxID=2895522 RepID=UPI001E4058E9|nr:ATP-grasp domain-containing protein [Brevibacillus humidisoli]UFJ43135.1 ATP-grasp domain-containing protein [Brevibacillus humidisoli]
MCRQYSGAGDCFGKENGTRAQDCHKEILSEGKSLAHIMFIESNPIGFEGIRRAKERGHRITFATTDLDYYHRRNQLQPVLQSIDKIIELPSYDDMDQAEAEIRKWLGGDQLDSIMTFNELHVAVAAQMAARFGLQGLPPQVARNARDKWKSRMLLQEQGIAVPRYQYVSDLEESLRIGHAIGYPVVVKPRDGTGSLYVRCIHNDHEMKQYFDELKSVTEYGRSVRRERGFLVEEFVYGTLISVETMTHSGHTDVIGITERDVTGYPYFVEIGSLFPSDHPQSELIRATAIQAIEALDIHFGICHIEMIATSSGPVVIEVNPRLAGGLIPKLIELATGIDMIEATLDLHLGKPVRLIPHKGRYAYSFHFTPPCVGKLTATKGWEQVISSPSVADAAWWKEDGALLPPLRSNFDRLGYVVVECDSGAQIREKTREIIQQMRLLIEYNL